ncbi:hypothetical protein PROFUN_16918 [Planoprotostelium fungivorum]|uniref:Uncharacterized protein n=1 Tax=Planoprotostelium fungivorum TaxID=1890364 RepID=A0A2P6MNG7_9EUKA|nr:hypothetical protein PROFUN_16918 [Planoprotostelium fungivorum]
MRQQEKKKLIVYSYFRLPTTDIENNKLLFPCNMSSKLIAHNASGAATITLGSIILHRIDQNKKDNPLVTLTLALDLQLTGGSVSAIAASVKQVAEEYRIVNRIWAMILA